MLGICGAALPAAAQVATGNVAGTVKDAQGGVIPGATVTLVSQTRGTSMETTTNPTATSSSSTWRRTHTPSE